MLKKECRWTYIGSLVGNRTVSLCVCQVFIFKDAGVQPHLSVGLISVRQKGGPPGPPPPPVIPVPESLAAQGPYVRLPCPGLARARNVSRHWGPPRACYRVPCCETLKRETPAAPRRVQGGLSGSPRVRWNKQRTEIPRPSSPAGTAAAECPEEEEPPAWEAPAAQISQRAPSPQGRGRLTMRHKAAKQRRRQPGDGEGRRGGG